ncbi:MAG TPA: NAD-dependent epimerase/dehydratase family protein [Dehalococcoidia bacterium]|nr:NAD-dependent epimerase/dehydratase family protein [Dehalococcoidia bacterium]
MRVFVTGGAGFLGSHVSNVLLQAGHQVTVLDNLSTGHREMVPKGAVFIKGDLKQEAKLREWLKGHDVVIHLAALVPVPVSVQHPVEFAENNVVNTVRLLEAMRLAGVKKIVFSSSATVYGLPRNLPLREDEPLGVQSNPYGATKVSAEAFVAAFQRLYNLDATILRYFNPYGPNELCEPETHLIPNVVQAALRDEPIPIFWKGEQVRDFIYVEDLAMAHVAVLGQTGLNYFNVGSEKGVKVKEVLSAVTDILDKPLRIKDLGERPGDVPALYATSERLRKATGWHAKVDLEEGLRRTVAFFRERQQLQPKARRGPKT